MYLVSLVPVWYQGTRCTSGAEALPGSAQTALRATSYAPTHGCVKFSCPRAKFLGGAGGKVRRQISRRLLNGNSPCSAPISTDGGQHTADHRCVWRADQAVPWPGPSHPRRQGQGAGQGALHAAFHRHAHGGWQVGSSQEKLGENLTKAEAIQRKNQNCPVPQRSFDKSPRPA